MAIYDRRRVRYRGRLVEVYTRNVYPLTVRVLVGKPLDFGRFTADVDCDPVDRSPDTERVLKLFARSATARE